MIKPADPTSPRSAAAIRHKETPCAEEEAGTDEGSIASAGLYKDEPTTEDVGCQLNVYCLVLWREVENMSTAQGKKTIFPL